MSDDRIQELESIGYQWVLLSEEELHDLWHDRFQELKKYMETHGHCNVPSRHGPLGRWIRTQRKNKWLLKEGKSSPMYDDCKQKLESIDFQWSCNQQRDSDAIMQSTTNNTPSEAKSGKYEKMV